MAFFTWLQDTPFAHWVASDPSLLAYPTILTLHTVGMAIVVGSCVVLGLHLLGIGADVPLRADKTGFETPMDVEADPQVGLLLL